jgi:antitoxin component YwqK of YwqJK toxin-antitoxin module
MTKKEKLNGDYWDNGNKKVETHYKNGKKEGLQTVWYESGEKEHEIYFQEGQETNFKK